MVAAGARLVELLPADEFDHEHLPRVIDVPLKRLDRETAEAISQSATDCRDAACQWR